MEDMRKFRHQHEQLRMVILRVLRPSVHEITSGMEGEVIEPPKQETFAMDDANAIEVIN